MFVCHNFEDPGGKPSVIPRELGQFNDETLDMATKTAVIESENLGLDMILYCRVDQNKKDISVWFGCRDAYGNTLHRCYKVDQGKKKVTPQRNLPFFNHWLPRVGKPSTVERFPDPVLTKIATNWALYSNEFASSLKKS